MADYTERFSEVWSLLGSIRGANASTEQNTGYVSLANYHRVMVIVIPVSLGSALDVDLEQGTDTSGTGAKTVDSGGKDITVALADTAPSVIELRTAEMDVTGGFDCLNVEVTPTAGSYFWCGIFGGVPRFAPVSTTNYDSVTD
jgi:hypothetical protein